jgi:hypothetical protein
LAFLPFLAVAAGTALTAGIGGAAIGGAWGFASGVAQSIDSDRRNGILGWDSIGSAYINGLIGGAKGAAIGFGFGFAGSLAVSSALAASVPAWIVGGAVFSTGVLGVGLGITNAATNWSQGNYASAIVDVAGAAFGASKLWSIYQGAKQQQLNRNSSDQTRPGYERPINQDLPLLPGGGQIETGTRSLAPATTPPGWSRGFDGALVANSSLMLAPAINLPAPGWIRAANGSLVLDPSQIWPDAFNATFPTVNRLEGRPRVVIDADGNVKLTRLTNRKRRDGVDVHVSLNDLERQYSLSIRENREDSVIKQFKITKEFAEKLRRNSVDEYEPDRRKNYPNTPYRVDKDFRDAYGIPQTLFDELERSIIPGSGKIIDPFTGKYIDPGKYTNPGKKYPKPKNKSK